jgi:fatty-acid desaturase
MKHHVEPPPHPYSWRTVAVLATVHAGAALAPFTFTKGGALLALFLYTVNCLGITIGYHRLLTHRSFKARRWLAYLMVTLGALSAQAGPATWVAIHRMHHANSDHDEDPHNASRGFWWAHMGWMLELAPRRLDPSFTRRFARDVMEDRYYRVLDRVFFPLCLLSGVLVWAVGGWPWVIWAMFLRIAAVFHATWLVNSAAHMFGYRTYSTADRSTNCWWVALLTFGEGWHNNHHAFPTSARHGRRWWEVDLSWMLILALARCGWIWDIRSGGSEPQNKHRHPVDSRPEPSPQPV